MADGASAQVGRGAVPAGIDRGRGAAGGVGSDPGAAGGDRVQVGRADARRAVRCRHVQLQHRP